jgi:ABC-2 type transport system permease protein
VRRIAAIVVHNLKLVAADRMALVWLLAMPVAFTFFIGIAIRGGGGGDVSPEDLTYYLTVMDLDTGPRGAELVDAIEADGRIALTREERLGENDAQRVRDLVADGERSSALIVPKGFSDSLATGAQASLEFVRNPERLNPHKTREAVDIVVSRLNVSESAERLAVEARTEIRGEPSPALAASLTDSARAFAARSWDPAPVTVAVETLGRNTDRESIVTGFAHSSPAMALMFILLNGLMMSSMLVDERRERTLRRLFTTPAGRGEIIIANLAWRFLVGLSQLAFLVLLGSLLFGVDWGESPIGLLVIGATYTAAVAALSVLIGSVTRNSRQAESLSLLLALSMCALGGLWWPLEITPRAYQIVGHAVPTGWAMDALHDIVSRGYGLTGVSTAALALAGFAAAFTVAAVLTFRPE